MGAPKLGSAAIGVAVVGKEAAAERIDGALEYPIARPPGHCPGALRANEGAAA